MTETPRICIVGAGAIGGLIAARLGQAGHAVSILARGRSLDALRRHGMRLESPEGNAAPPVQADDDAARLGRQDLLILGLKAPALPEVAPKLAPLIGPDTVILPVVNGIPWWFFLGGGLALSDTRLRSVDPDGVVAAHLPTGQVLGSVIFASASMPEPGLSRHASGNRILLGEPYSDASAPASPRAEAVAGLLRQAGFDAVVSPNMRAAVWNKLLGNACFNPVSMITGAHTDDMIDDTRLHAMFVAIMEELLGLAARLGLPMDVSPLERLAVTRKLGHVKTSMLQDREAGRPVELDSIVGAVVETAELAGVPMPTLGSVYAMARMQARLLGLYTG